MDVNKRLSAFSTLKFQKESSSSLNNRTTVSNVSYDHEPTVSSQKEERSNKFSWKKIKKIIKTPMKKRRSSSYSIAPDSVIKGSLQDTPAAISDSLINDASVLGFSGINLKKNHESTPSAPITNRKTLKNRRFNSDHVLNSCKAKKRSCSERSLPNLAASISNEDHPKHKKRKLGKHSGSAISLPMTLLAKETVDNEIFEDNTIEDSQQEARKMFQWLIQPVKLNKFFNELWEKKPLLLKRHKPTYYSGLFNSNELDRILKEENVYFSENIDVTSYVNGKRQTHNPVGRAYAPVVWNYYQSGCSVRFLNPQTYSRNTWKILSILQDYFGCMVGANVYLTPQGTQGFAPHYDDIEAFVIQLEGKKHWRLYNPRNSQEVLPRFSSENFTDRDIGSPVLETVLEAGDMLYFPRGIIHQANSLPDTHSLHMTISCFQKNAWIDLLEKVVPRALEIAAEEDVDFRQSLPLDYLNYTGIAFSESESASRQGFMQRLRELMAKLADYAPVDAACDQMGKRFIHDSLPPALSNDEKVQTVNGVKGTVTLKPSTAIKLVRKHVLRLVIEEDVTIYFNSDNSRIYHGRELQGFIIDEELAPAVEHLIMSYPNFVRVEDLPVEEIDRKIEIATILFDKGLLLMKNNSLRDHESSV